MPPRHSLAAPGRHRIAALALLLCLAASACHRRVPVAQVATTPAPPPDRPDIVLSPAHQPFKFVAYGDIRFSSPNAFTNRLSNPFARDAIVQAIVDAKPAFVVISGDLVLRGGNSADWQRFDRETKPLADAHLPLFPTVGNHEYYNNEFLTRARRAGLHNYFARFPQIPNRPATPWYSLRYANCYFLMLDSVDDDSPASPQLAWLEQQLDHLPPGTDFVFLVLHHPPRTAATDREHRARASEIHLADLVAQRQRQSASPRFVIIAGHVHNYERFDYDGVPVIVSGGGGARPHGLNRRPDDLYHPEHPGEVEYHYCVISVDHDRLKFQMYRLADGTPAKFELRDSFELGPATPPADTNSR